MRITKTLLVKKNLGLTQTSLDAKLLVMEEKVTWKSCSESSVLGVQLLRLGEISKFQKFAKDLENFHEIFYFFFIFLTPCSH